MKEILKAVSCELTRRVTLCGCISAHSLVNSHICEGTIKAKQVSSRLSESMLGFSENGGKPHILQLHCCAKLASLLSGPVIY